MIYKLVPPSHPLLHEVMPDWDFDNPPCDIEELIFNMVETMKHHRGYGLSANQCGLPYRMFVVDAKVPIAYFNARIVDRSKEEIELEEGCLTYPGLTCKVFRSRHIKVRYENLDGVVCNATYTNITSRVIQHEIDHSNGITFIDRLPTRYHKDRAMNKWKILARRHVKKEKQPA